MVTKVEKWGKGYGIRLSKRILNDANLDAGEKLRITVRAGRIIVEPVNREATYNLSELVARIPSDDVPVEVWGRAFGTEVW
jgi:antitoxin component of MazEF toxin-antitoxin module